MGFWYLKGQTFVAAFQVASVAYDFLPANGVLSRLYQTDAFVEFLRDVLGLPALYRLEDPFGACSINLFKPGKQMMLQYRMDAQESRPQNSFLDAFFVVR